ncbi:DUF2268 domain-containing putative Zn-dependent protease [Chitinophaga sp. 22620]|uniref:DUF2268 domain-containing putative Zn-dependent protease n=1 Tax=Chitinophaga sp. 22620 TaxID=3453952 RepID=UPI003F8346DC
MKIRTLLFTLFLYFSASAQTAQIVFTSDIDRFWQAYDSVQTTKDSLRQLQYIQTLYLDKGTPGLKAFMAARNYNAPLYVNRIRQYPAFWASIRPNTFSVKQYVPQIERSIERFKELYPALKDAKMYFTVGALRSGGTTSGNLVLIGTEIATGDSTIDVSEFPSKWLADVFSKQKPDNIVSLNIHEYVHTQQKGEPKDLLSLAIQEGSCDFITELVQGRPLLTSYIVYGDAHEAALKEKFKQEMFSDGFQSWMYEGNNAATMADLGYYMGYTICRSYYKNAKDKKKAVAEIIELDYADSLAVQNFLVRSGYYKEKLDRPALMQAYQKKRPVVERIEPFTNGDTTVSADTKEIRFVFSTVMSPARYSFSQGSGGKEQYPEAEKPQFAADNRSIVLKVKLEPGRNYNLTLTDLGFKSADGYPLVPYEVKFRTK